jgi:septal ring-binding cell division protein DamX/type II secretory pathway predicted ATPase ExeA
MATSTRDFDLGQHFEVREDKGMAFFKEAGRGKSLVHIFNLCKFNPGLILLIGESGSGKSTLISKLVERIQEKSGAMFRIDSVPQSEHEMYLALARAMKIQVGTNTETNIAISIPDGSGGEADINAFLDQADLGLEADASVLAPLVERVHDALRRELVRRRPVVLAVDDFSGCHRTAAEALIQLFASFKGLNLLFAGDHRLPDDLAMYHLANLTCHEVELGRLTEEECQQYLIWRLDFPVTENQVSEAFQSSHGNLAKLERSASRLADRNTAHLDSDKGFLQEFVRSMRPAVVMAFMLFGFILMGVVFLPESKRTIKSLSGLLETDQQIATGPAKTIEAAEVKTPEKASSVAAKNKDEGGVISSDVKNSLVTDTDGAESPVVSSLANATVKSETFKRGEADKVVRKLEPDVGSNKMDSSPRLSPAPKTASKVRTLTTATAEDKNTRSVSSSVKISNSSKAVSREPVPVSTSPSKPETTTSGYGGLMLSADEKVLMAQPVTNMTVQMIGAQSRSSADDLVNLLRGVEDVWLYRSRRDGKIWYGVVYGSFPDRESAIGAFGKLPEAARVGQPWPRKFGDIQQLIRER